MSRVIAVVDNNQMIRDLVAFLLPRAGYTPRVFETGVDFLSHYDPAVSGAVMGIFLPGMDGFSVVRQMRASGMSMPVLLLASLYPSEDEVRESGAEVLQMPFRPAELLRTLRRVFSVLEDFECDEPFIVQAGT